jgi:hypothetical protein
MAHEAMHDYPVTRRILMGADPANRGRNTPIITHNFEGPQVDNYRTGAVNTAARIRAAGVGPSVPAAAAAANAPVAAALGAAPPGNAAIVSERARFAEEAKDPKTAQDLRSVADMETGDDPRNAIEALANRSAYYGSIGHHKTIQQLLHGGFYGPVNKGELPGRGRNMSAATKARMQAGVDAVVGGSDILKGYTDQGGLQDPNAGHRPRMVWPHGEVNNDWGGGEFPGMGHAGAEKWRLEHQKHAREGIGSSHPDYGTLHDPELTRASKGVGVVGSIKGNADINIKLAAAVPTKTAKAPFPEVNRGKNPTASEVA